MSGAAGQVLQVYVAEEFPEESVNVLTSTRPAELLHCSGGVTACLDRSVALSRQGVVLHS